MTLRDDEIGFCASHRSLVRLRDGAEVLLREAAPDDAARLSHMFFQLSGDTRFLYFFAGVPPTEHWAQRFITLGASNGHSSYALVAQADTDIVGLARFDCGPDAWTAEVGILLVDVWQSRGLGQRMLSQLSKEARRRGVTTFTGRILGDNRRALALARRVFPRLRVAWAGEHELTAPLDSMPDDPDDTGGA
jgi:RimJ/RimL family protein N-acetyltransferase